jgi:hypothetical protein
VQTRAAWGLGALLCALSPLAHAQPEPAISFEGYTGLLNVPSADVTPDGRLDPALSNHLEGRYAHHTGPRNALFSLGLWPYLELGGRLAESSGLRDLSGNLKVRVPFLPVWAPALALGYQDFAGAGRRFRSRYAVATESIGPLRLSLGYGLGPDRMRGIFGGASLQATDEVSFLADYDTRDVHLGARFVSPSYRGIRAMVMGQVEATDLRHLELAVGLQLPMRRTYEQPEAHVASLPPRAPPVVASPQRLPDGEGPTHALRELKARLIAHGCEDVRVGLADGEILVVEYENHRYAVSELDALGLVLGIAAERAPHEVSALFVVAKRQRVPVLEVRTRISDYLDFLDGGRARAPLDVRHPHRRYDHRDTLWVAEDLAAPRVLARVDLYPVFSHFVATEVGVVDVALALGADVSAPLWPGAAASTTWQLPVARTANFDEGGPFSRYRPEAGLRHAQLHQGLRVSPSVIAMISGGLYRSRYAGAHAEAIVSPGEGTHALHGRAGLFQAGGDDRRTTWLGTYRYRHAASDTSLAITYGQYWYQDGGYTLELARRFDDLDVTLVYKYNTDHAAGLRISVPLTPRREPMAPRAVHIRGPERVSAGLQTSVWRDDGTNRVTPGIAVMPTQRHDLARSYLDHDRLDPAYVRARAERLRDAYRRWGAGS